jgi:enoyl-CoA hydratase/carnithine racemase
MISVKKNAPSGTIVLDRPAKRNAIDRQMLGLLAQALQDLHQEKIVRAVILAASGPVFCSGIDLSEWQETSLSQNALEQRQQDVVQLHEVLEQMLRFPKPIIAAVDGAAMGFGLSLVLACDLVVASGRSTFATASAKLGLVSGFSAPLLAFRLGASTASRLLLGQAELDSEEARQLGLVHHVVKGGQIWVRAHQWAQEIATGAPEAMQLTKRLLNEMVGESVSVWLASGAQAMAASCTTEAATEGLKSFSTKSGKRED